MRVLSIDASLRNTGELTRSRAGRYTSQVTVTLPGSWHGAFRYASCFRPSPGSGMGDPRATCPRLKLACGGPLVTLSAFQPSRAKTAKIC